MARIHIEEASKYQKSLNGEWFSLKNDGDIAMIQFMYNTIDDMKAFVCHKVEVDGKERYVDCLRTYDEPVDNCPFCAAGLPVKPVRFVEMYQHDDEKVKIWERGPQFISILQGLFNRYTPLSEYVFEIERFGKAGSKDTKYQVFPMDKAEPVDMSEIERPTLLGGIILDKTFEDMETYLQMGSFPETEDKQAQPQVQRRGAQTQRRENPQSNNNISSRRGGNTPEQPQISRRVRPQATDETEVF